MNKINAMIISMEKAVELPERQDLFTIYRFENRYYWESEDRAGGPYVTLRIALQDLALELDMREGRFPF